MLHEHSPVFAGLWRAVQRTLSAALISFRISAKSTTTKPLMSACTPAFAATRPAANSGANGKAASE